IEVNEKVVQLIEGFPFLIPGIQRPGLLISFVKAGGKAPEQLGKGEIDLPVAVVSGGINQVGDAVGTGHPVAAPKVTVQERRADGWILQPLVQVIDQIGEQPLPAKREVFSFSGEL